MGVLRGSPSPPVPSAQHPDSLALLSALQDQAAQDLRTALAPVPIPLGPGHSLAESASLSSNEADRASGFGRRRQLAV